MKTHQADSIEKLVQTSIALDNLLEASQYAEQLHELSASMETPITKSLLLSDVSLAWAMEDVSVATRVLSMAGAMDCSPIPRAAQTLRSIQAAIALLSGTGRLPNAELQVLQTLHDGGKYFGGQDFPTSVIAESYMRAGQTTSAELLVSDYLASARREYNRVPYCLTHIVSAASI